MTAGAGNLTGLKEALAARLPGRAAAAVAEYEAFARQPPPEDAKGFAAHHAACKAALAHVEVLVKLLRWAAPADAGAGAVAAQEADDLSRLIAEARAAMTEDDDLDEDPDGSACDDG